MKAILPVLLAILLSHPARAGFAFGKGDRICYLGNGLADRMQYEGWLETLLQAAHPDLELVFRNLGYTGDQVAKRPRSKGFASPEDYLKLCGADVIFVFFGYNESFGGEGGLAAFKRDYGRMIDSYRALKPNGADAPRFVLFSPIAHEDLGDPNLPDGRANNARLARYTQAVAEVAAEKQAAFVDLFGVSKALCAKSSEALTINGVHLGAEGNRQLAVVIAEKLLGRPAPAARSLETLREAVVDKNLHWRQRYRAPDGNDVWGGRSKLRFVDGQTNATVLTRELTMFDVMTANRDKRIHAVARGGDPRVDDRNVPSPVPVRSAVGGGSPSSKASKEGSATYLGGKEAIAKMTVPKGFEVGLFADEKMFPELVNPVQLQVDARGRLWAAAWQTYPKWEPLKKLTDRLLILPDDNRDGVADRVVTFAEVHNPIGFEFWNGGVLVTSHSDLLFLKDTDGDDVADLRVVLLQGLGTADTHHAPNNFIHGPDGAIYWQSGVFLQNSFEHPRGPALLTGAAGMYRFDPRRYTISFHAANAPNAHGISFDCWGYHYATDGTSGRAYQVRPDGRGFKMFKLLEKQVRPVPASEIVSSAQFPPDMQGDFLICNAIGFLGLKHYGLNRDPATGRVRGEPKEDLLQSTDGNFRPTDAIFGADGALYIADWHNIIIGHMQYNVRDPSRDHRHGRIYRMIAKDRPLQKPVRIAGADLPALMANLAHPVDGVRHRTRIELGARDSKEVVAACREWLKKFDPANREDAHHILEGLWVHQQHNVRNSKLLELVLQSPEPHARHAAATVRQHWTSADPATNPQVAPVVEAKAPAKVAVPKHLSRKDHRAYRLGAEVFAREAHCTTCHQPNGAGLPPIYPPLTGSPWVTGSEERLIKIALHGIWGPIEVNGTTFDPAKGIPPMTPFAAILDDRELAAVLTYVRNSWGNQAPAVSPQSVGKIRKAHKDRFVFWKPEELLKDHPMEE